ncbi:MAG: rod shape-determining protein MreD [Bacteroidetes bacterium]|nr:rod shape-determining protein MreD [Bacteroidota bacterium]MBU1718644.1 rod shape-determining protein MreD [Bacteroidota bacterium]
MNKYFPHIGRFVLLILFQVLILNKIYLFNMINPFVYVMFLIMLPFETPGWILLIIGFFTGLTIDIFSDTLGMHAAASVLMCFSRPIVQRYVLPREQDYVQPSLNDLGLYRFVSFAGILVLIHHFSLFYIEIFRFQGFFYTMVRVLASSVFSIGLILLILTLINISKDRKR